MLTKLSYNNVKMDKCNKTDNTYYSITDRIVNSYTKSLLVQNISYHKVGVRNIGGSKIFARGIQ